MLPVTSGKLTEVKAAHPLNALEEIFCSPGIVAEVRLAHPSNTLLPIPVTYWKFTDSRTWQLRNADSPMVPVAFGIAAEAKREQL
jgi:hypothetical protein